MYELVVREAFRSLFHSHLAVSQYGSQLNQTTKMIILKKGAQLSFNHGKFNNFEFHL